MLLALLLLLLLQHWCLVRFLPLVLHWRKVWLPCPAAALLQRVPLQQPQLRLLSLLMLVRAQVCWLLLRALADRWQLLAPSASVLLAHLLLLLFLLLLKLVLHCQVPLLAGPAVEAQGPSQDA